jgi:hypothetical protein
VRRARSSKESGTGCSKGCCKIGRTRCWKYSLLGRLSSRPRLAGCIRSAERRCMKGEGRGNQSPGQRSGQSAHSQTSASKMHRPAVVSRNAQTPPRVQKAGREAARSRWQGPPVSERVGLPCLNYLGVGTGEGCVVCSGQRGCQAGVRERPGSSGVGKHRFRFAHAGLATCLPTERRGQSTCGGESRSTIPALECVRCDPWLQHTATADDSNSNSD